MRLLNIGCGPHYHQAWTNIDMVSSSPDIMQHNIRKGLPFSDNTFDAVYHSHLIEHLPASHALSFLGEALRVLKPHAVMRIVTPDLEAIARLYLAKLEAALDSAKEAEQDYDWTILELFDQCVRNQSGGDMLKFLLRRDLGNREFVLGRIGHEAANIWNDYGAGNKQSLISTIRSRKPAHLFAALKKRLAGQWIRLAAGRAAKRAYTIGTFRESGEIHHVLYDRFSLKRLMLRAGLADIRVCDAGESRIQNFNSYGLDIVDGKIRKPDSFFMEGVKP